MNLRVTGTGECVCTDYTLLYDIVVLVEDVLDCAVVEFVLACVSCELHNIFFVMNNSLIHNFFAITFI